MRPEKRVTARSKLPQKKWTGLSFPMNRERKTFNTRSACDKGLPETTRHGSVVSAWVRSSSKGTAFSISLGIVQIWT